jgi:uncharacterized membrane protein
MKKWSKTKTVLIILLVLFLAVQAAQPSPNKGAATGPKDVTHVVEVPDSVMAVLKKSCYDCHSDYTTYVWYDKITPVNFWIDHHINEGKRELNFSAFGEYTAKRQAKKLDEIAEQVEKHEMPLGSYTLMHTDAKLTDSQRKLLISWAEAAMNQVKQP